MQWIGERVVASAHLPEDAFFHRAGEAGQGAGADHSSDNGEDLADGTPSQLRPSFGESANQRTELPVTLRARPCLRKSVNAQLRAIVPVGALRVRKFTPVRSLQGRHLAPSRTRAGGMVCSGPA